VIGEPLLWSGLWVVAATITAFLPMRRQYIPGIPLLVVAPVLIFWIGSVHGWWVSALALAAFASMFRNPIKYFWAKARGQNPQLPPELERKGRS
jgi:hypothetical protein